MSIIFKSDGNDWMKIRVRDLKANRTLLNDEIKWCKFSSIEWLPDSSGFLYTRFAKPAAGNYSGYDTEKLHFNGIYYHKMGTEQDKDVLIYRNEQYPYHSISARLSNNNQFLKIDL